MPTQPTSEDKGEKFIKISPDFFKDCEWKIEVSPFGDKLCCCGEPNCVDVDCLMYSIEHKLI